MYERLSYSIWKKDHKSILETFSDKKVIVPFSGGKDSSVILHLIQKAAADFNFIFETHAALFPHHVFTEVDITRLVHYWNNRGVDITWHEVPVPEEHLARAVEDGDNPCLICMRTKKASLMNNFKQSNSQWKDLVVIMSYSLWDIVSATVEHILGTHYSHDEDTVPVQKKNSEERFLGTFQRFYPLLKLENGLMVFKPLIRYNDQEIKNVVSEKRIPLTTTSCRYRKYRPKRLFAEYYERSGLCFEFDKVFDFAKKSLNLPAISYFENLETETYVKKML